MSATPAFPDQIRNRLSLHLQDLEAKRLDLIKLLKKRRIWTACGVAMIALSGLAIHLLADTEPFVTGVITLVLMLACLILGITWSDVPKRAFRMNFKTHLIPEIASAFGELRYQQDGKISMLYLEPSKLIPGHSVYRGEDLFRGRYKDVDIEFCEAHLVKTSHWEIKTPYGNYSRGDRTVFQGVFLLLKINKSFNGHTVVRQDAGALGNWAQEAFGGKLKRVILEDPGFERHFEVYAEDQVEARYLLTPAFMDRLTTLVNSWGSVGVEAAFYGSRLMIMLPRREWNPVKISMHVGFWRVLLSDRVGKLFEPDSLFTPLAKSGAVERITCNIRSVVEIVDLLNLHEKTRL